MALKKLIIDELIEQTIDRYLTTVNTSTVKITSKLTDDTQLHLLTENIPAIIDIERTHTIYINAARNDTDPLLCCVGLIDPR